MCLLCVIPTVLAAKEKVLVREEKEEKGRVLGVFVKIIKGFPRMPRDVVKTSVVYFFAWCAYSNYTVYLTQYFATRGKQKYQLTNKKKFLNKNE